MPRLVDRDAKRREILEVTWRLMATQGADAATMREIAREAGYANGALAYYFANKEALIEAAYSYVFDRTNDRIRAATAGLRGVAALRAFLVEVLPTTELTVLEARIVLPFWSRTVTDERLGEISDAAMTTWRRDPDGILAEQLLAMAMGLQVLATLPTNPTPPETQLGLLDTFLAGLRAG